MTVEARKSYLWGLINKAPKIITPPFRETLEKYTDSRLGAVFVTTLRLEDADSVEVRTSYASSNKSNSTVKTLREDQINQHDLKSVRTRWGTQTAYSWRATESELS